MYFMSANLSGTRQARKLIGHMLTAGRVVYGIPVFMTMTPGERHSTLTCHLTRYRSNDPGITIGSPELRDVAGYSQPSLLEVSVGHRQNILELFERVLR